MFRGQWRPERKSFDFHIEGLSEAAAHGSSVALLWGRLFGCSLDDALELYEDYGASALEQLDGEFALVLFDERKSRLLLVADPLGTRSLYWRATKTTVYFGNCLGDCNQAWDVDQHSLAHQVSFGAPPAGRSLARGIYPVGPGHYRSFRFDLGTDELPYRQLERGPVFANETRYDEVLDQFGRVWDSALAKRAAVARRTTVSVSGGIDSSAVLGSLHKLGADCCGVTYSTTSAACPANEMAYINALRSSCGVAIDTLRPVSPVSPQSIERNLRVTDSPYVDLLADFTHATLASAHQKGSDTFMTGHMGDQVMAPMGYLADGILQGRWLMVWQHIQERSHYYDDVGAAAFWKGLAKEVLRHFIPDQAIAAKRRCLPSRFINRATDLPVAGYQGVQIPRLLTMHQREVYTCAYLPAHRHNIQWMAKVADSFGLHLSLPFWDHELLQWLMYVPGHLVARDGVPRSLMRDHLKGVLPEAILRRRDKGDFSAVVARGWREMGRNVSDLDLLNGVGSSLPASWQNLDSFGLQMFRRIHQERLGDRALLGI